MTGKDIDMLLLEMRKQLTPSSESSVPSEFQQQLKKALGTKAKVVIGGSYAKGTYLPEDHDIDLFIRFPLGTQDEVMSAELEQALISFCTPQRVKGSRDYFQIYYKHYDFECVPVLAISKQSEAHNVTDMSPLHVEYALAHFAKNPSLQADIRLAKQFFKAGKVYGAESYINGFSGHVVDLLVMSYGGFLPLVEAISDWGKKTFIDPTGKHTTTEFLDKAKREGPLVLLDPVQTQRNAAAAVSVHRYALLKEHVQAFLASPSKDFFTKHALTKEIILKNCPRAHIYELHAKAGSKDIVGTKLLKIHEHILKELAQHEFNVQHEGFEFDGKKALCYVELEQDSLGPLTKRIGPPVKEKDYSARFREVHQGNTVYEEKGRLVVSLPREFKKASELLKSLLASSYTRNRALSAKIL